VGSGDGGVIGISFRYHNENNFDYYEYQEGCQAQSQSGQTPKAKSASADINC
jgi:hypothetical protein